MIRKVRNFSHMSLINFSDINIDSGTTELYIMGNYLEKLGYIPSSVKEIYLTNNKIENIDNLHDGINIILCRKNKIKKINKLPKSLIYLDVRNNPLGSIDGIWNCKDIKHIEFDQDNLYDEIETYCKLTYCNMVYNKSRY